MSSPVVLSVISITIEPSSSFVLNEIIPLEADLDPEPLETLAALEDYAEGTSSTLVLLALEILGARGSAVARLLAALPKQVASPVPGSAGGAGLLALLQRSGHLYEATLGRAARAGLTGDLAERVAVDWKGALLSALAAEEEGPA